MLDKGQKSIALYVAEGQMGQENVHSPHIDTIHTECGSLKRKFKLAQHEITPKGLGQNMKEIL